MTAAANLIRDMAGDGLTLSLADGGTIRAVGPQDALDRHLPALRTHKAALVEALTPMSARDFIAVVDYLAALNAKHHNPTADNYNAQGLAYYDARATFLENPAKLIRIVQEAKEAAL